LETISSGSVRVRIERADSNDGKDSAQNLFRRAIRRGALRPRVINTDLAPTYLTPMAGLQRSGDMPRRVGIGPCSI